MLRLLGGSAPRTGAEHDGSETGEAVEEEDCFEELTIRGTDECFIKHR